MALDLTLSITADASDAKRELAAVEQGIKKIETASKATQDPLSKVTSQIGGLGEKTKETVRIQELSADATSQQMTQWILATNKAEMLAKEQAILGGSAATLTAATGLSITAMVAWSTAAGIAVVGATAVAAAIGQSVRTYFEHSKATQDSRDALDDLAKSWTGFQMVVGGAVLGSDFSIRRPIDYLNQGLAITAFLIAQAADRWHRFATMMAESEVGGPVQAAGVLYTEGTRRPFPEIARNTFSSQGLKMWQESIAGMSALYPTSSTSALQQFEAAERERTQALERLAREAAAAAKKLADERARIMGFVPNQYQGLSSAPGMHYPISVPTLLSTFGMPGLDSTLGSLPGTAQALPRFDQFMNLPTGLLGRSFGTMGNFGGDLGSVLLQALQGGGNPLLSGAAFGGNAIGSGIVSGFSKDFAGSFGGQMLSGILPGLGGLAVSGISALVSKLFGPTEYEQRVRAEAQGRREINAGVDLGDLRGMADFTGRGDLLSQFLNIRNTATPDVLKKLLGELEASTDKLTTAMQRYGISWEELGDRAQQSHLDQMAKTLIEDFEVLNLAGADTTLVITKMGDATNDFVQAALRTGSEVPAAMKPMLERMIEMGLLTDESGEAFSSLEDTGITFAKTMTQGFDSIAGAIDRLAIALGYIPPKIDAIGGAADEAGDSLDRMGRRAERDGSEFFEPQMAETGGYLHRGRVLQSYARGGYIGDSFPIMAHSGEFVMNRSAVQRYGLGTMHAMNSGRGGVGSGVNITNNFHQPVVTSSHTAMAQFSDVIDKAVTSALRRRGIPI